MITDQLTTLIQNVLAELAKLKLDVGRFELDHFGYQTSSTTEYESKKLEVAQLAEQVREAEVDKRRVAIYKLFEPLIIANYQIRAFELIEPKPSQATDSYLEHVEFIIDQPFTGFVKQYPQIDWDFSAMNREQFAKVTINLPGRIRVKFQQRSILAET